MAVPRRVGGSKGGSVDLQGFGCGVADWCRAAKIQTTLIHLERFNEMKFGGEGSFGSEPRKKILTIWMEDLKEREREEYYRTTLSFHIFKGVTGYPHS